MIRKLAEHQVGQRVRSDGPQPPVEGPARHHGRRPGLVGSSPRRCWARPRQPLRVDRARRQGAFGLIGFCRRYLKLVVRRLARLIAATSISGSPSPASAPPSPVRDAKTPNRDDADRAVLQGLRAARSPLFIVVALLVIVGLLECGQPHRRLAAPRSCRRWLVPARSACSPTRRATWCSANYLGIPYNAAPARCW